VDVLARTAKLIYGETGLDNICLSGGSFQNVFLLEHLKRRLEAEGLNVFTHSEVPCGDGGLSLGQALVAAHRSQLFRESAAFPSDQGAKLAPPASVQWHE